MTRLIMAVILVPLALLIILLSVANRAPVVLSLDPLSDNTPIYALSAPLFIVILGAIIFGVLLGSIVVWWSQRRYRRALRQQNDELERLKAIVAHQHTTSDFATQYFHPGEVKVLPTRPNI